MARISSYTQDASVASDDRLVGTSSDGTTKTYTLSSIAKHFTESNSVSVNGQQNLKFITGSESIGDGSFFLNNFSGDGSNIADITTVSISKNTSKGQDIETLLREMFADKIKIASTSNPAVYATFQVDDISQHPTYQDFLQISISNGSGYGTLLSDDNYSFVEIFESSKTYVHTQSENSTTWEVEHNLDKYPSVTVVDTGDNILYTEVEYIDKNNLEIRFVASTSGKAFIN